MNSAYRKIFIISCLNFILVAAAPAQQPVGKIEYYSTEQGLSHQRTTAIMKDREGFMWFGTWNGINRFDGRNFVAYKSSPRDSFQLSNSRIDRIAEDQSEHLWVQTADNHIYQFDKKTEKFLPLSALVDFKGNQKFTFKNIMLASGAWVWLQSEDQGVLCISQTSPQKKQAIHYRKEAAAEYRLPSNEINFFHEDNEHRIWIGTAAGLTCLENAVSGIYTNSKIIPVSIASDIVFTKVTEDDNCLYFGTANGQLIIYTKKSRTFTICKITSGRINALLRSRNRPVVYAASSLGEVVTVNIGELKVSPAIYHTKENLFTLFEDRSGTLWIQPEKFGVIRFDPLNRLFQLFDLRVGKAAFNPANRFFRVLEDSNGNVWVCMKGGGLSYYNPAKNLFEQILHTPDTINYHLPEIVNNLYYDSSGIMWVTVNQRGLIKIALQDNDFKRPAMASESTSQAENEIRGICYDRTGRLWLGAKKNRLYVYQNNVPLNNLFVNEPSEGLTGVYAIVEDSRANIWIGTKGNGLFKATPVNNGGTKYRLSHFLPDKKNADSLPSNSIYALLEDRQGRVWIGSMDAGLVLIDEGPMGIRFIHSGNGLRNYPTGDFKNIRHMAMDRHGNVWLGTTNGLVVMDAGMQQSTGYRFKVYNTTPGDYESLGNNDIQFIHRDIKNRMWLATSGGGFCQAIGDDPFQAVRFKNYTVKDGLPNDYILSCAEDKQGNIWLATENGLSKFNPETGTCRNYDSHDGVPKTAFSEASVTSQKMGEQFFFGTATGYLSFYPERINNIQKQANIVFTNLQINNEEVGPRSANTMLKVNVNYISQLTLKHNQNIITISYSIPDYAASGRQPFVYRLLGFDTVWQNDHGFGRATYTNLPPGEYIYEVKSLSTDLYLNTPYKRLYITILPPLWKTWWAYLTYVLLLVVLLYFIRRYTLAMLGLRNKIAIEQKLAALKMNFFTNISHELRTPLTLILNPLEQLAKKEQLSTEGAAYVSVIHRNASRMVRFINQLLDLRKVQSEKATLHISRVEIISFVKSMSEYFTEAAKSKSIDVRIISELKELIVWVDAEKLDVIIYNLLGNAIKFTPPGKSISLLISSVPEQQHFVIAVHDQGPGVPKDDLENIFELFQEGPHTNGREMKGTGIGLALTKEFIKLHGGTIWAENNNDGGLTVTVKLRTGSDHFTQNEFVADRQLIPNANESRDELQLLQQMENAISDNNEQAPLVLLVEDNDELRLFIRMQLGEFYRVETAKDGEEGLQKAVNLLPDLIVSDIMMPKVDGIQLLDKIKNNMTTSHIPVVLLSAKYSIESLLEGLRYGADYYITKPFNNELLIASIDNLLRQRKKLFDLLVAKKDAIEYNVEPVVVTSKDELFLKEVIKVVEEKIGDAQFKIDEVAESMAMSHKTFYRKFKSLTGLTPVEFVRDIRLQKAKQLFDAGISNISEVAYSVGFSVPGYFSTCFKDKYHVSPTDYIKERIK